jgi:EAL domain-containing protein (putative c-di-GMP-specific phosphodiesterase class I)
MQRPVTGKIWSALQQLVGRSRAEAARRPHGPVDTLIATRSFKVLYQPVVDLASGELLAYEAVTRPQLDAFADVQAMIQAAVVAGRMGELGRLIRQAALEGCAQHPIFINVDPNELDQGWLVRPDDPLFFHDHPVHLEITESAPLDYFEQCKGVLSEIRGKGISLVIDDLGSGYSNLRYIADLEPDLVKVDRSLVEGLKRGDARFCLLRSIATLCSELGAEVVAEGIEDVEQLLASREAGVRYGQGFLLGRPAATPEAPGWPAEVPVTPRTELRIVSNLPTDREPHERGPSPAQRAQGGQRG